MHKQSLRVVAMIAVALVTALAGADRASAAGAVSISACQILSDANTTYKLTNDLISLGNCLNVANDKITIDLQGFSIVSIKGFGAAISDLGTAFDVITVKNGTVSGYAIGVNLAASTRVSVLGVNVKQNLAAGITGVTGIAVGPQGLVKASETEGNNVGIQVGDRGQVQQCNSHDNIQGILATGNDCLITMNTATLNVGAGIGINGNKCTVSYNTASNNAVGISALGSGHLVTHNVALNNSNNVGCLGVSACLVAPNVDFEINCPSTVTYNDSTNGFPASYVLTGTGCKTVGNE